MVRYSITDAQWELVAPLLPGKALDPGRSGSDNRLALEGILHIIRTGIPWRDLPPRFGKWTTVYQRFRRWTRSGVFDHIFETTRGEMDLRTIQVDGTYVKAHQHSAGAPKTDARPMTQSGVNQSGEAVAG